MKDVVLHAFNWNYTTIAARAKQIADSGFGAVLFPPLLYSEESSSIWWQRYQPIDYRVIRSYLGRKEHLVAAVTALRDVGVRSYADVVFNHMANDKQTRQKRGQKDLYNFPGSFELVRYKNEAREFEKDRLYGSLSDGLFGPQDFNPEGNISDWNNPYRVEEEWLNGLPDLDLTDWVVDQQCTTLRALRDLGFSGYRIDAMKHLPVEHLMRVFTIQAMDKSFVFGEILTTNDREEATFLWPIIEHTHFPCYDFPMHEMLRRAFSYWGTLRELVDPASTGNALPWYRSLTFTHTHDIPNNDGFRGMMLQPQDEYLANAFVMGRDGGVPLVYSDNNESAGRYSADRDRWAGAWCRRDITGMIRFHNALQGAPQRCVYEADGFVVFARGDRGILAINKTEEWQHPRIWTWGLKQGRYHCQIHDWDMDVRGDMFDFAISPREAQMWLYAG